MKPRRERKIDRTLRRVERQAEQDVAPNGYVRGFHGGCPAVEGFPRPLGTYALVPDPDGGVMCEACGERGLLPHITAANALRGLS